MCDRGDVKYSRILDSSRPATKFYDPDTDGQPQFAPKNETPLVKHLGGREDKENGNDGDEKDDDCDDDDDEKKCKTRTATKSLTASTTPTPPATQPSAAPANPANNPPSIPAPIPTSQPPPTSLAAPTPQPPPPAAASTLATSKSVPSPPPVPSNPPAVSVSPGPSSVQPGATSSTPLETSIVPLPTDQTLTLVPPVSSAAAAPASGTTTTTTPPPTQASTSSSNARRTAGIVFLILAFFAIFAAIFLFRSWRARRKRRTAEKAKAVAEPGSPPPPPRPARDLPPLTSNPPMVSLPPPPPTQRSGQAPAQSSFTPSSSMYSEPAVLGPQGEKRVVIARSQAEASRRETSQAPAPQPPSGEEKPQINYAIRTFFQSAIDRRVRNAELAQARVESWPPPPYIGKKEPRAGSWRGVALKPAKQTERLLSQHSIPGQRNYSSTSHESMIPPWRSSVESDVSSLSSGWGDGPPIPTPVLITQKPLMDRKIMVSTTR
ncbi:hypothetical protein CMUS01_10419 [Colletotrichum musicola]|uniref:Uncharacterized protein n=1 Tax=Colletotrichum musicola TaxID=2175873 RepID=A0A8H6N953_9PEZI|nr:hypothetical protein CMUS01_10419 [Colletotrichum musicola]